MRQGVREGGCPMSREDLAGIDMGRADMRRMEEIP